MSLQRNGGQIVALTGCSKS